MSERYIVTSAGFTFCRDCGNLIMEGYREQHDRMHPPFSCERLGHGVHHLPDGLHSWEEVYPRVPDTRASVEGGQP